VDPRPDLDPQLADGLDEGAGAPDGGRRLLERGEEPVPGRVELSPAVALERLADEAMVAIDERLPAPVTELLGTAVESTMSVNSTAARIRREPDVAMDGTIDGCLREVNRLAT
jgi:hypothetical protein